MEQMHAVVSTVIDHALAWLSVEDFDTGVLWAIAIGVVLGLVILGILTAYPGERTLDADGRPIILENAADSSPSKSMERHLDEDSIPTMQILNLLVKVCLFSACIFYLNRDYDGCITKWFARAFPREAKTLGLGSEL